MPTAKKLQRAVWILLGVSAVCVCWGVIEPADQRMWIRFGPAKYQALPFQSTIGIACALAAGVVAMVAVVVSFFTPRDQQKQDATPDAKGNVPNTDP